MVFKKEDKMYKGFLFAKKGQVVEVAESDVKHWEKRGGELVKDEPKEKPAPKAKQQVKMKPAVEEKPKDEVKLEVEEKKVSKK